MSDLRQAFARLSTTEPDLGEPHIKVPDLTGKTVLVIGATYPTGFGYNIGKVSAIEGNATVVLTASKPKGVSRLAQRISNWQNPRSFATICDVTSHDHIDQLVQYIRKSHGRLDVLIVTPAYIDRQYLTPQTTWQDVPEDAKEECRRITVYPIAEITRAMQSLMIKKDGTGGVAYALSFCGHDMPGYTIGAAKKELEELVTGTLASEMQPTGIRANILSLGPYESVASSAVPGLPTLRRLIPMLGAKELTLGEMIREAAATFTLPATGQIYDIDGGLRKAIMNPQNKPLLEKAYREILGAVQ